MTPVRFYPRQWIRWITGRLGLTERYDIITIDLKSEYLEEAKELSNDKIIIDSTFSFDDVKQAYERLVCCEMFSSLKPELLSCRDSRTLCFVGGIADSLSKRIRIRVVPAARLSWKCPNRNPIKRFNTNHVLHHPISDSLDSCSPFVVRECYR